MKWNPLERKRIDVINSPQKNRNNKLTINSYLYNRQSGEITSLISKIFENFNISKRASDFQTWNPKVQHVRGIYERAINQSGYFSLFQMLRNLTLSPLIAPFTYKHA